MSECVPNMGQDMHKLVIKCVNGTPTNVS